MLKIMTVSMFFYFDYAGYNVIILSEYIIENWKINHLNWIGHVKIRYWYYISKCLFRAPEFVLSNMSNKRCIRNNGMLILGTRLFQPLIKWSLCKYYMHDSKWILYTNRKDTFYFYISYWFGSFIVNEVFNPYIK